VYTIVWHFTRVDKQFLGAVKSQQCTRVKCQTIVYTRASSTDHSIRESMPFPVRVFERFFLRSGVLLRDARFGYKKNFSSYLNIGSSLRHLPLVRGLITFLRRKIFRGCVARSRRGLGRAVSRCVPVTVIKHFVIDARVNLKYRGFTENWLKKLTIPLD